MYAADAPPCRAQDRLIYLRTRLKALFLIEGPMTVTGRRVHLTSDNTMPERCEAYRKVIPFDRITALVDNAQGESIDPHGPNKKEVELIMEPTEEKLKALEEAYEVLCKTGDHSQWVAAFEAAYGKKPVYIPQH